MANVVEIRSDSDDFDSRRPAPPAKRKVPESPAAKAKAPGSAEKARRSVKPKPPPPSMPPPPSVAPPQPAPAAPPAIVTPSVSPFKSIRATADAFLSTPPATLSQPDDDLLDVVWQSDLRLGKPSSQEQNVAAARAPPMRPPERSEKQPQPAKRPLDFEVQTMEPALSSLLEALEKPAALPPTPMNPPRSNSSPSSASLIQRSPVSQTRHLAIKSPAAAASPAPTQHTPSPPADAQPVSAQATAKPAPLTIADIIASPAPKPPPASPTAAKPPAPSAKPTPLSRSTSASIISSSPLPPPLPSIAKPAPQSLVAPAALPPPPPSPTATLAPKAMLASPPPAVVRTNTVPVLESPVVAKSDPPPKALAASPAPSLARSTATEPPAVAMKADAKFATPASVVKPPPAAAKTPAAKPSASLPPAPAPGTPVVKPSASAPAAATSATPKAAPAAAAPSAPSPAPAPSTPKPPAVAAARPATPMPSVQQAIAASRAPKQAPPVARASSLPAQPPKPAGVTAASSAAVVTSAPRAASLPSLPVHAPLPPRPPSVKPPGAVRPPPPADPEPALGPGGDFLSDDQLDLLLSDPVTLSQIDQWTAAPAAQNDSAPPLPPTPRLSAPLSNVRFPPGAPHNVHRLRVQSVAHGEERSPPGQPKRSRTFTKRLTVRDERSGFTRFVTLKDEWVDLEIAPDDFVNVIGDFDAQGNCTVDCNNNSLIHYPDTLVNITLITSTNHCLRKSILGERYRGYSQSSDAVYGTLIHGVFQSVLHRGDFSDDAFQRAITREIDASLGALFAVGETEQDARERLRSFIPNLQAWHKSFVDSSGGGGGGDGGGNGPGNAEAAPALQRSVSFGKQQNVPIAIPKILEIEESISSPVYGIKGKIDVSVEVASIDGRMRFVAPLELKGGKKHGSDGSVYHKAQVYLYMLLMTERYRQEVDKGLLFYLAADMEGLRQDPNMKRSLLVNRNQVARHLANNTLPPPLRNPFKCGNCQSLSLCMVVHKSSEGGTVESSGLGDTFTRATAHVSDEHAAFLRLWDRIVDLEAAENVRQQPWLHTSAEQERRGRCLADMVLERQEAAAGAFLYTFRKRLSPLEQASPTSQSSRTSLLDRFEATRGDFVALSTEDGHYGVARGSIVELAPQFIVVALDDELRVLPRVPAAAPAAAQDKASAQPVPLEALFDVERVFECLTPGSERQGEARHHHRGRPALRDANGKHTWRIDREDLVSTEGTVRNNVAMLFTPPESRLRALVVDLAPPQFDFATGDERLARLPPQSLRSLNGDQRRSLHMVLAARDYALILGMPGTGKSTTIVSIVQALVALGHSVLITSYTNNAVDNLLLKLAAANVDFLRISSRRRESAKELEKYTLNSVRHNSLEEYRQFVEARQVVGATCLNAHHAVIARRRFDYCIVDEASQITLPICVGPLRYANVFVLVGDHYQLPPVVRSSGAHELGGDVSLFRRLAERHSNALAALEYQYRMNKEIMALPNALVYEGRLQCGTQSIASRRLSLPSMPALIELVGPSHWLITGVNPAQANVFFNTDALGRNEQKAEGAATTTGGGVYNKTEVKLIARLVQALVIAGLNPSKIGVIAAYRAQLRFIRYGLGEPLRTLVEVDTVDRYQGRDKDCIIISLVRANDRGEVGELLLDARRLNVALSRAKCKLIVVGSQGTFAPSEIYASLFRILAEQNSIFDLPPDAPALGAAEVATGAARLLQASMAGQ